MSRWKVHSICQLIAKILVFLMVIQGWLFWEASKEYNWYPDKFSKNFSWIIGFFGPKAAHASVQLKTLTSVTCIRKKGKPILETFTFTGYSGPASPQLINSR